MAVAATAFEMPNVRNEVKLKEKSELALILENGKLAKELTELSSKY